ncbi:UDP-N-acetylglucosamine 2-epimerase, partial [Acinetobacter baumannii]
PDYLFAERLPPYLLIKTPTPIFDLLHHYKAKIEASDLLERLNLKEHEYFIVSAHREENINSDQNFLDLVEMLNAVAERY